MPRSAVEAARSILADKGQGRNLPTDLLALLRDEWVELEFLQTRASFEGCTKLVGGKPSIFVNTRWRNLDDGRVRFTLAHEVGHYFLHRSRIRRGHPFIDRVIAPEEDHGDELEREANEFASECLLPSSLVRAFIRGTILGLDRVEALREKAHASLQATAIKVTRESSSRLCVFWERDGVIQWSSPSDDWREARYPWSRWHGQPAPLGARAREEQGSFREHEVPLKAWHPNHWVDDDQVVFESALSTTFGRLVLVIDGSSDGIIED